MKKYMPHLVTFLVVAAFLYLVISIGHKYGNWTGVVDLFWFALFTSCIIGFFAFEGMKDVQKYWNYRKFKNNSDAKHFGIGDFILVLLFITFAIVFVHYMRDLFVLTNLTDEESRANYWIFIGLGSIPATAMFIYGKLLKNKIAHTVWKMIFWFSCIALGVFNTFQNVGFWNKTDTSHWVMTGEHVHGPAENLLMTLIIFPLIIAGFAALGGIIIYGIVKLIVGWFIHKS